MIIKSYEENKIDLDKQKLHQGQIHDLIDNNFKKKFKENIYRYDENELLNNESLIFEQIQTNSFFEDKKLIIITRTTDKIKPIIEQIAQIKIKDINIILISNILDKKSKLRSFFEKHKSLICIPFYKDNEQSLSNLVIKFCKEKKISMSRQLINLIIRRSLNDRCALKNELGKVESFCLTNKDITEDEILKLTNPQENHNISTLIDNCLIRNEKKIIEIINENIFSSEEAIQIIRIYLAKAKRLLSLTTEIENTKNMDSALVSFKPPIFWKDKEIVKKQLKIWTKEKINNLIIRIVSTELLIKKNSYNAINILLNFIFKEAAAKN